MGIIEAVILALIQGITEFLPISSSAHLILLPKLTGWPDQGLAFDVALHAATSLAICIYLRSDLKILVRGLFSTFTGPPASSGAGRGGRQEAKVAWMILVATVPVGIAGLLARDLVSLQLRTIEVIAVSSIVWGIVLWIADLNPGSGEIWKNKGDNNGNGIGWKTAIFIGLAQAVSLIPGTSRSGITITAGLFTGLSRDSAVRFSFLLSVPIGIMAGAYEMIKLFKTGVDANFTLLLVGFVVAFVFAYITIHLFLKMIQGFSLKGFVVYRVLLGVLLLLLF